MGSNVQNSDRAKVFKQLVGSCPVLSIKLCDVDVYSLLDTGSMVSTITESFFNEHFSALGEQDIEDCRWLGLKAANGLDIPYIGYITLTVSIYGTQVPNCGVLVVKDPPSPSGQEQKKCIPGILGMNIVRDFYYALLHKYGVALFQSPEVESGHPAWKLALRYCEKREAVLNSTEAYKVRVQGRTPVHVAAGTLTMVPVTCPQLPASSSTEFLLEPLESDEGILPDGLLLSPALVKAERGLLYAPVTNVGVRDVWISPRRLIGSVQIAKATLRHSHPTVELSFDESSHEYIAQIASQEVQDVVDQGVDFSMLSFTNLSEGRQAKPSSYYVDIGLFFLRGRVMWGVLNSLLTKSH